MLPFVRMLEYGNSAPIPFKFKDVTGGSSCYFVLTFDNKLYAIGMSGQFGDGAQNSSRDSYGKFKLLRSDVKRVWSINSATLILTTSNTFWLCGDGRCINDNVSGAYSNWVNITNKCGFNTFLNSDDYDSLKLYMGMYGIHILKSNGDMYSTGLLPNVIGMSARTIFTLNKQNISFINISSSGTFCVSTSGELFGVNQNNYGQLGLGHNNAVPNWYSFGTGYKFAVTGQYSSMRVSSTGAVETTGLQLRGQLGNGYTGTGWETSGGWIVPNGILPVVNSIGDERLVFNSYSNLWAWNESLYCVGLNGGGTFGLGPDTVEQNIYDITEVQLPIDVKYLFSFGSAYTICSDFRDVYVCGDYRLIPGETSNSSVFIKVQLPF